MKRTDLQIAQARKARKTSVTASLIESATVEDKLRLAIHSHLESDGNATDRLELVRQLLTQVQAGKVLRPEIEAIGWHGFVNRATASFKEASRELKKRIALECVEAEIERIAAGEYEDLKELELEMKDAPNVELAQIYVSLVGNKALFTSEVVECLNEVKVKVKDEDANSGDLCAKVVEYQLSSLLTSVQEDQDMEQEAVISVAVAIGYEEKFFNAIKKAVKKEFKVTRLDVWRAPETQGKEVIQAADKGKVKIQDWAGNVKFKGRTWDNFEDAEDFLSEHLGDKYEEDRQEFDIVEAGTKVKAEVSELHKKAALLLLAEAAASQAESDFQENDTDENSYILEQMVRSQEDLMDTVPQAAEEHGLDINQYLPFKLVNEMDAAVKKNWGLTLEELAEKINEDAALATVLGMLGHGVSAWDDYKEQLLALGIDKDKDLGYFESAYDEGSRFIEDMKVAVKELNPDSEASVLAEILGDAKHTLAGTIQFHAQPYGDGEGFYFKDMKEFEAGIKKLKALGLEEVEIQFIDGDSGDSELFEALKLGQGNINLWFDEVEDMDESQKAALYFETSDLGIAADDAIENAKNGERMIAENTLEDYAYEFLKESYKEIMEGPLGNYIDYKSYANDLKLGGDMTEFEFGGSTYVAENR